MQRLQCSEELWSSDVLWCSDVLWSSDVLQRLQCSREVLEDDGGHLHAC
jgi:hypothetical protein